MIHLSTQEKAQLRELCTVDGHAWPTVLLFVAGCLIMVASMLLGWHEHYAASFFVAMVSQYLLYTCMHEAVHRTASKSRGMNWLIGVVSASTLFAPYTGFRYVHLKHHRFTNHEQKDPDIWSARSLLVLRWLTQDLYYYVVYMKDGGFRFPTFWRVVLQFVINFSILALMVSLKGWAWPLFCWLLPGRFVIGWLSLVFNYLPHHPHDPEVQNIALKDTSARPSGFLALLLIGQNLHNIHHLWPAAPFYRYAAIWKIVGPELRRNGALVKDKLFEL